MCISSWSVEMCVVFVMEKHPNIEMIPDSNFHSMDIEYTANLFGHTVTLFGNAINLNTHTNTQNTEFGCILFSSENPFPISYPTATRSPSYLRLELHLYHFPMVALQCTLTPPPSDSPALPHLMQNLSRSDTTTSVECVSNHNKLRTHTHKQHGGSLSKPTRWWIFLSQWSTVHSGEMTKIP